MKLSLDEALGLMPRVDFCMECHKDIDVTDGAYVLDDKKVVMGVVCSTCYGKNVFPLYEEGR